MKPAVTLHAAGLASQVSPPSAEMASDMHEKLVRSAL
jgi:hypothetical protein